MLLRFITKYSIALKMVKKIRKKRESLYLLLVPLFEALTLPFG